LGTPAWPWPHLDEPVALKDLWPQINEELLLVPWEEGVEPLQKRLTGPVPRSVAFLIGPEGGLTADEVEQAGQAGFQTVSLGPRILRSETAGIAVASILQYLFGDLGSNTSGQSPAS
jgi:16S rRNA (uracil1498-N3)-methyltransferase